MLLYELLLVHAFLVVVCDIVAVVSMISLLLLSLYCHCSGIVAAPRAAPFVFVRGDVVCHQIDEERNF